MAPQRRYPHAAIVEAHLAGATRASLRAAYGVSAETVRKIIRQAGMKSWREGKMRPPFKTCHPLLEEIANIASRDGWSYERLAVRAGASRSAVMTWFRNRKAPGFLFVFYLADALGYEIVLRRKSDG